MAQKEDSVKDFYDRSYKKIFSHKGFVRYLLESFVRLKWVQLVDFDKITLEPVSFIDRLYKKKEADVIWKLPLKNGSDAYLYLLLEFQSGIDRKMPLRFASYILNFYANELKKKTSNKLPVVFPLLLYNGKQRWSAPRSIQEIIDIVDPSLREYALRFKYFTIDIGSFSKRSLIRLKRNLIVAMFLLEKARNEKELKTVFGEIIDIIKNEADQQLLQSFTDWLEMVLKREKINEINLKEIVTKKGEHTMLVETLHEILIKREQKGIKEGVKEGVKKGKYEGKLETAKKLLAKGYSVDFVAEVTELPVQEIEKLKERLD